MIFKFYNYKVTGGFGTFEVFQIYKNTPPLKQLREREPGD